MHDALRLVEHMVLVIPEMHEASGFGEVGRDAVRLERFCSAGHDRWKIDQRLYQLALYETLVKADIGQPWFELNLRQVGYKKVRSIVPP